MAEKPKPDKSARRRRNPPRGKKQRASDPLFGSRELDLRTLLVLSVGDWWDFADSEWPPEEISAWVEQANLRELRGLLLATLQRWHDLAS